MPRFGTPIRQIVPGNRCKVADEQKVLLSCFAVTDKAENAAVFIVGIDPLKTVPAIIFAVKSRIFFVNMKQIPDVILESALAVRWSDTSPEPLFHPIRGAVRNPDP